MAKLRTLQTEVEEDAHMAECGLQAYLKGPRAQGPC